MPEPIVSLFKISTSLMYKKMTPLTTRSHAICRVIMNYQSTYKEGWFLSNKYHPFVRLGIDACISSRITTVIQVVRDYQINYNWLNEPFAVSLYNIYT